MNTTKLLPPGFVLAVALLASGFAANAGELGLDARREEAARLEEKARALKESGRHDEGHKLMIEVEEIRASVEKGRPSEAMEEERRALREKLEHLRAEMNELSAAGRPDQAGEVKARMGKLKQRQQELDRQERPAPRREGPEGREFPERMEHVKIAVKHLHEAGLHDAANRIALLAEERFRLGQDGGPSPEIRRPDGSSPRPKLPAGDPNAGMREMREQLRELLRRIEKLEQDRR